MKRVRSCSTFVLRATEILEQGTRDFDLTRFRGDVWVQSAAERQLIVIGEAVRRMREFDPEMAARLSDVRSIVGFRNILIHSYEQIDVEIVWPAIQTRIPQLRSEVRRLLSDSSPAGS